MRIRLRARRVWTRAACADGPWWYGLELDPPASAAQDAWEAFGKDDRFAMIGLSLDSKSDAARQFARTNGMGWAQGFLGEWSKTSVPKDYAVEGIPAVFLLGPDGKIEKIYSKVKAQGHAAEVLKNLPA